MTNDVVEVEELRVEVAGRGYDIVDDVTFSVAAGEVLGLAGESGSGKTTVGLALLGHTRRGARIVHGNIRIHGRNLLQQGNAELRAMRGKTVSYVPQDPASALNPALRIGWQLEESLVAHGYGSREQRRARLQEMLGEVRLPLHSSFLSRYPHQLSGGQQQRIALAIAFACRPRVIVLDEPTTGLDVTTQAHVLRTVRQLCDVYNVAAVYISHDLAVVSTLADRVAIMYAGRVVEVGSARQVFNAAAHPYTRRLVEAIPKINGHDVLRGMTGGAPHPGHRPGGCFFAPRCALVIDRCRREFPPVTLVSETHQVRCFRHAATERAREPRPLNSIAIDRSSSPLLDVSDVNAAHGNRQVVFDLNLSIRPKHCVALVGESGSGKTTLARCIVGLHRKFTGEISLRGQPLPSRARERSRDARREIQYVFQSPYRSLNPRKTVGEIVAQPLRHFFGHDRQATHNRIVRTLERVAMDARVLSRYPHELSGGERQRVAIARALVAEPLLLVCDEITSALDVLVQAAIVALLAELQRDMNLGLLFVTHNLALTRTVAQEVAVMREGRIVEFGKVEDVLDSPTSDYTKSLLADTPSLA
jgi:peptide/nickel transport system ATP-binding protein